MEPGIDALIYPGLFGAAVSLFTAALGFYLSNRHLKKIESGQWTDYAFRMQELSNSLSDTSSELDRMLAEITGITQQRAESLKELEAKLEQLNEQEKQTGERLKALENVSLPAVQYFLEATRKSEKQSAWRDYLLFGSGVLLSTVITIILKVVFGI